MMHDYVVEVSQIQDIMRQYLYLSEEIDTKSQQWILPIFHLPFYYAHFGKTKYQKEIGYSYKTASCPCVLFLSLLSRLPNVPMILQLSLKGFLNLTLAI
jgi:hypothetical protein